jgi:DUF438 domain-containing protein
MVQIDPKKRSVVADIIRRLHGGLSVEEAKSEILSKVGALTSTEITQIEQGLIDEGVSPDEIRRFCNVHALLFESALEKQVAAPGSAAHPVAMLRKDNQEIARLATALREALARADGPAVEAGFARLKAVARHYSIKENALFPLLEQRGFPGPSKVMWSKHDEVRSMLKLAADPATRNPAVLGSLLDEIEGMIFKEEKILFPAALDRLTAADWVQVFRAAEEVGYPFAVSAGLHSALEAAEARPDADPAAGPNASPALAGAITLPTGTFAIEELVGMLNVLPVDVTFVDAEDRVKYFSQSKDRIFVRTTAVIGRLVQNCHPPQSLKKVTDILQAFRDGTRDHADFWIKMGGKFIYIRYFAVRDPGGRYLGTLEVTQDVTEIRKLDGERRLLGE